MNRTITLTLIGLLVATSLSGCIENMQDLKERMGAAETEAEPVEQQAVEDDLLANDTSETNETTKPPVARMTIYGAKGALVYKSSFIAEDVAEPIYTTAPAALKLIATDSEIFEPGAEFTEYTWDFAGMIMEGAQVEHALEGPGTYPITLTVKDSKGGVDTQNLTLAVTPQPFDVVTTVTTGPTAGAVGAGQAGTATYDLTLTIEDKPHKVTKLVFQTKGGTNCDTILSVTDPNGETTGPQDTGSQETMTFGEGIEGTYTIQIDGFACASPGVNIEITATYIEIVDGLPEGDGHAHAH